MKHKMSVKFVSYSDKKLLYFAIPSYLQREMRYDNLKIDYVNFPLKISVLKKYAETCIYMFLEYSLTWLLDL